MLEAQVNGAEELNFLSELLSDPSSHEESREDKAHYTSKLIRDHNKNGSDEEGVSLTQSFGESKGTTIG
jgi:hypothetical protein